MWVSVGLLNKASKKSWTSVGLLVNCGSVWVIVGQEGVVVRKVESVGLLVNWSNKATEPDLIIICCDRCRLLCLLSTTSDNHQTYSEVD